MSWRFIAVWLCGSIALLSIAATVFGGHAVKQLTQSRLSDALGRPVKIGGTVKLAMEREWRLVVEATGVRVDGPQSFPDDSRLLEIDEVRGLLRLRRLLRGDVQLTELRLVHPRLTLVRRSDGPANWEGGHPLSSDHLPSIDTLEVDRGKITYVDPRRGAELVVDVQTVADARGQPILRIEGGGTFADEPSKLAVEISNRFVADGGAPALPVHVETRIGGTSSTMRGGLTRQLSSKGFELDLGLKGTSKS